MWDVNPENNTRALIEVGRQRARERERERFDFGM